ncbi:C25 family cysteine peptidase [Candidatus Eisenbacteria bacterium]|uniref:C25 family cysteine peptidase n=1 Tax=Eiseniibacteriota bacterium TaxID=2212470 RepID=A0ABV6YL26_UNCEI
MLTIQATWRSYPSSAGAAADPVYSLVAGSDNYPDIFVGRLSAENSGQVDLQIQKFLEYESMPEDGGSWYHKGTGIGSEEGSGIGDDGEADWEHMEVIHDKLTRFTYSQVDSVYAPFGASASMVTNAVNAGRSIINYCGHGSMNAWSTTGFSSSHVNNLVNHNMLPWIVSVACVNGKFHTGTCFAESWMRASDGGQPTGAIGMYASTVNMSWAPPMAAQDETVDLLVGGEKRTFGALCFSGSCQMMDEYGGGASEFKNWHIFGDPSLRVRSDTPTLLTVGHDPSIDPLATTFAVSVPGVGGALCGLSYNGEYLGSAFTDELGEAEITVVGALPAELTITLTVTSFNTMPYVTEISVGEPLIPAMLLEPDSFRFFVQTGDTDTEDIFITNVGEEGSMLNYTIEIVQGPSEEWLSVKPGQGSSRQGDEPDVHELLVDTAGLLGGIYEAEIHVTSNGGDAVIPVTLYALTLQDVVDRLDPRVLSLSPARPNPFGSTTTIAFALPQPGPARVGVYDMSGRLVRTLVSGVQNAGLHRVTWDGRDDAGTNVPGGVYFYRLDNSLTSLSGKVMVLE